jgi:adenylosuccinate lyase
MKRIWGTNKRKFAAWREVEIAVLNAREMLNQIPDGNARRTDLKTWVDEKVTVAIERRDHLVRHDLNAFIDIMRLQLLLPEEVDRIFSLENDEAFNAAVTEGLKHRHENDTASFFHDGMTSYDTEEPAMAMLLRDSSALIKKSLWRLGTLLRASAVSHRGQIMVGRTHGQHAQPITFGKKLLDWFDLIVRANKSLDEAHEQINVMKLSGAVGLYGTLGPDVEEEVGKQLSLTPVIATQIVSLDRRARLVNELAIIASVVEKIAFDLWIMAQTEIGEIREPFGKMQKGSSAMPHKKNPITLEKIRGLSRHVRSCAMSTMENVATSHERDISHSSVERIAVVDAFAILDHMLFELTRIIEGMDVFPERMLANLEMTFGTIASQKVEMFLKQKGIPAETAYRVVQQACAEAMSSRTHLRELLRAKTELVIILGDDALSEIDTCFDWKMWVEHEDSIYEKQGVNS